MHDDYSLIIISKATTHEMIKTENWQAMLMVKNPSYITINDFLFGF